MYYLRSVVYASESLAMGGAAVSVGPRAATAGRGVGVGVGVGVGMGVGVGVGMVIYAMVRVHRPGRSSRVWGKLMSRDGENERWDYLS